MATLIGSTWNTHKPQILRETGDLATILYKIFKYTSRLNIISARKAKENNSFWWRQFVENLDDVLKKVKNIVTLITCLDGDGLLQNMIEAGIKNQDLVRIVADLIIAAGDTVIIQFFIQLNRLFIYLRDVEDYNDQKIITSCTNL